VTSRAAPRKWIFTCGTFFGRRCLGSRGDRSAWRVARLRPVGRGGEEPAGAPAVGLAAGHPVEQSKRSLPYPCRSAPASTPADQAGSVARALPAKSGSAVRENSQKYRYIRYLGSRGQAGVG